MSLDYAKENSDDELERIKVKLVNTHVADEKKRKIRSDLNKKLAILSSMNQHEAAPPFSFGFISFEKKH